MAANRTQIGIAVGAGALIVLVFLGYIWWLSNQGPVLARSEEHDPLSGLPVSIKMNPMRDRSTERAAGKFLHALRDGRCDELLELYAFYKQATVGDVSGSRPGMFDLKGRAKYDAWAKKKGLGRDAAMQGYADLVDELKKREG